MERRVVITGMGAVTPLGNNVETYWKNLKNGVLGIDFIKNVDTENFETKIAAEVKDFNPEEVLEDIDNDEFEFDEPDDEQTFRTQIVEYDKQVEMEQRSFVNWQLSLCCQNIAKSVNILEKCILKKPYYGMMIKHWRNSKNEPIDDVTSRISYEK